jgi:4-carboxymuconolactone decarboxylase
MTRIATLKREEMNAEQGRVFDAAEKAGQPTGGPYTAYIRTPKLMEVSQQLAATIREYGLSGRERQIAILTVVRHWNAKFPWAAQVRASLAAGVDQPTIDAINAGKTPTLSSEREKLAHQVAKELVGRKSVQDRGAGGAGRRVRAVLHGVLHRQCLRRHPAARGARARIGAAYRRPRSASLSILAAPLFGSASRNATDVGTL